MWLLFASAFYKNEIKTRVIDKVIYSIQFHVLLSTRTYKIMFTKPAKRQVLLNNAMSCNRHFTFWSSYCVKCLISLLKQSRIFCTRPNCPLSDPDPFQAYTDVIFQLFHWLEKEAMDIAHFKIRSQ